MQVAQKSFCFMQIVSLSDEAWMILQFRECFSGCKIGGMNEE